MSRGVISRRRSRSAPSHRHTVTSSGISGIVAYALHIVVVFQRFNQLQQLLPALAVDRDRVDGNVGDLRSLDRDSRGGDGVPSLSRTPWAKSPPQKLPLRCAHHPRRRPGRLPAGDPPPRSDLIAMIPCFCELESDRPAGGEVAAALFEDRSAVPARCAARLLVSASIMIATPPGRTLRRSSLRNFRRRVRRSP